MADYAQGQNIYRSNSSASSPGGSSSAHGTGEMVDLPKSAAPTKPTQSLAEMAAKNKAAKPASAPAPDKDKPKKVYTTDDLKSYKHGTDYVPETGPANLHKGEAVLDKEEAEQYRASKSTGHSEEKGSMEHSPEEKAHFHRAMSHLHQGGLHRALGISENEKIPLEKKQAAAHSDNPHVAAMGRLAVAMHGWKH